MSRQASLSAGLSNRLPWCHPDRPTALSSFLSLSGNLPLGFGPLRRHLFGQDRLLVGLRDWCPALWADVLQPLLVASLEFWIVGGAIQCLQSLAPLSTHVSANPSARSNEQAEGSSVMPRALPYGSGQSPKCHSIFVTPLDSNIEPTWKTLSPTGWNFSNRRPLKANKP
jgi:hypothetical protein